MRTTRNTDESAQVSANAYMDVTRLPDGRYCVLYIDGSVNRRSYTPSIEQVIKQAQRAGSIPVRTDDPTLRQRCRDMALRLIENGKE